METQRKQKVERYGFGPSSPSRNLSFPSHANLTAVEILTFLPNSVRCANVVYRFISNGGTRHALWAIINTNRDFPQQWDANCCGVYMYKAMREAGYKGWTVKIHDDWHAVAKATWDETNLGVGGFRSPGQLRGGDLAADVPFESLAVDVRSMPQGDDALDLTRMILHCVQSLQHKWMYPRDYEKLLNQLGGPAPVRQEHLDRSVFARWNTFTPPPPRIWSKEEIDAVKEESKTKTKWTRPRKRRMHTQAAHEQPREAMPTGDEQQMTRNKSRKPARIEELDMEEEQMDTENETPQYVREPAEYVATPGDVTAPSDAVVLLAFANEGAVGETDSFSAYAFGGPRHKPPYRMLHDIQQPDPTDISGWAENLRWALEQRACFWHAVQTERWNESPQHMELIATTRMKQVWASDELLDQLPDVEDEYD